MMIEFQSETRFQKSRNIVFFVAIFIGLSNAVHAAPPPEPVATLSATPASVNFGNVVVGAVTDLDLVLNNNGTADASIGPITSLSTPFSIVTDNCSNTVVEPATFCLLTLRYSPVSVQTDSTSLEVFYTDPLSQQSLLTVQLSGTGTPANTQVPDISVNKTSVSLGNVNVNATMSTTITVSNVV